MCDETKKDIRTKKMACYHAVEIVDKAKISPEELVKHYDITLNQTEPDVKEDIRELYSYLPKVELNLWQNVNLPKGVNVKKFITQIKFINAIISNLLEANTVYVVGTHEANGMLLPVYQIEIQGLKITFSSDFNGWEIVVCTEKELNLLKNGGFENSGMSFKGFPEDVKTYESIIENCHKFSIKLGNDHEFYEFMKKLKESL